MPTFPQATTFFNRQWRRAFKPDSTVSLEYFQDDLSWSNQRSAGFENPAWREMVARHSNAGTPLSGSTFTIDRNRIRGRVFFSLEAARNGVSPQKLTWEVLGDLLTPSQMPVLSPFVDQTTRDTAVEACLTIFYKRAWEGIRSFQSGIFLGEIKEALSMIRTPGKALRLGIDSYTRLASARALRAMRLQGRGPRNPHSRAVGRALSDTWLESAFGWAPLISDIESGAQAIARLALEPQEYRTFKAKAERSKDLITPALASRQSVLFINLMRYWYSTSKYVGTVSVQMNGEVKVQVENPYVFAQDVLGFNWNDFAPTAWELIPYSFLIDYFTNIGDVISAWSFPRSRLTWWNRSIRNVAERQYCMTKRPTPNPNSTDYKITADSGPSFVAGTYRTSFTRDQPLLGLPSVTLTIPGFGLQWLNMGALASSRVLSFKTPF